jgi:hypothetical protein
MRIARVIAIVAVVLMVAGLVLGTGCGGGGGPQGAKITLSDAPVLLDLSPLLTARFEHLDAASEGMSNEDMGLGPTFISPEPYQMIYGFIEIVETLTQRYAQDAVYRDEQQIRNLVYRGLKEGAASQGYELSESEVEIDITYPNIADLAVLGEGRVSMYASYGFDMLIFRSNEVYVYLYSLDLSPERQLLAPIATEIAHRISMFSQTLSQLQTETSEERLNRIREKAGLPPL